MRLSTLLAHTAGCLVAAMPLVLTAQAPVKPARPDEPSFAAFDRFYLDSLQHAGVVGSGLAFIRDGRVIHQVFHGLGNIDTKRAVDDRTIFHWASITKTFTAIAIMQLRDRGKLRLDDPLVKYLPELRQVHDPYGDMSEVTIARTMSHSAGFRGATWPWGGDKPWHPFEPRSWEQLAAMLPYTEIEFEPGSKYSYSNPGLVFLGRIIERLSGDDYEVYIDKNILKPLQMYDTYFDTTPYHLLPYRAASYSLVGGKLQPAPFDADTGITVSNGGLNSPLRDMAKYLSFLLGTATTPEQQAVYDGVLKRSSLEEMWKPRVEIPDAGPGKDRRDYMGLSFFIEENAGMRLVAHSGHQNEFSSHFYLNPAARAGYVVAYNTMARASADAPAETDRIDLEIKDYLLANIFPALRK